MFLFEDMENELEGLEENSEPNPTQDFDPNLDELMGISFEIENTESLPDFSFPELTAKDYSELLANRIRERRERSSIQQNFANKLNKKMF